MIALLLLAGLALGADTRTVTVYASGAASGTPVTLCAGTAGNADVYGSQTSLRPKARFTVPTGVAVRVGAVAGAVGATGSVGSSTVLSLSMTSGVDGCPTFDDAAPLPGYTAPVTAAPPVVAGGHTKPKTAPTFASKPTSTFAPGPGRRTEYCFGAAGMQCGSDNIGEFKIALCTPNALANGGICLINSGSFAHDTCCWNNPGGVACGGTGGSATACQAEWDLSVSRVGGGYSWSRQLDFTRGNTTGVVEFDRYCAQTGARVHRGDVALCCDRAGADPAPAVELLVRPDLQVCR